MKTNEAHLVAILNIDRIAARKQAMRERSDKARAYAQLHGIAIAERRVEIVPGWTLEEILSREA